MRYIIAFLFLSLALPAHAETTTGRVSAIDRDTLEIHGTRIRLYGIEAP